MWLPIISVAATMAVMRLAGHKGKSFQAMAHLYVGLLFGLGIGFQSIFYSWTGAALTFVELVAFVWARYHMTPAERRGLGDC